MIKINLLGDDASVDPSRYYILAGYVVSLVVLAGVLISVQAVISAKVSELSTEAETLKTQLAKLEETTKEVHELKDKKDELNQKLIVIATLKKSKIGPVRLLDDLNMAIPEKSWLLEAKESGNILKLVGLALDNQTVSKFMKDLEVSDYFEPVDLVEATQVEERGVKMSKFTVQSKVNYAGKFKAPLIVEKEKEDSGKGKKAKPKVDKKADEEPL